jgi:hypothetical protein
MTTRAPHDTASTVDAQHFTLGTAVSSSDGPCGELRRVIVDTRHRTVTHIVVAAKHHRLGGHLVPVALVRSTSPTVTLACTTAQLAQLPDSETTEWFPVPTSAFAGLGGMGAPGHLQAVVRDRVPYGECEIVRGDRVFATDGPIGRVHGLVTLPADEQITHLLLDEGHPWGRREVIVPIDALEAIDNGLRLNLTKAEILSLPASQPIEQP